MTIITGYEPKCSHLCLNEHNIASERLSWGLGPIIIKSNLDHIKSNKMTSNNNAFQINEDDERADYTRNNVAKVDPNTMHNDNRFQNNEENEGADHTRNNIVEVAPNTIQNRTNNASFQSVERSDGANYTRNNKVEVVPNVIRINAADATTDFSDSAESNDNVNAANTNSNFDDGAVNANATNNIINNFHDNMVNAPHARL